MQLSDEKLAYGVKPLAHAVGLSAATIWEALKNKELKSFKVGSRRLIAKKDVLEWLETHRKESGDSHE
ncbi:MAG: DNA-binding protein [Alphaproteobacteria bacterium]|nr:DNA-binding protein [Alphaproteobacteria bacterium]